MRDVRPWTYAALFGTLWGALEATLGTAVHLGKLPFRGAIMGLVGLLCLVCLRRLQPRPGVCLLAGVVAIFPQDPNTRFCTAFLSLGLCLFAPFSATAGF